MEETSSSGVKYPTGLVVLLIAGIVLVAMYSCWAWADIAKARRAETLEYSGASTSQEVCTVREVKARTLVDTFECGELKVHKRVGPYLKVGVSYEVRVTKDFGANWTETDEVKEN